MGEQRIDRDKLNMSIAHDIAKRSTCTRGQVGCVITQEGRIVSTGYVGAPSGLPHCTDVGCEIGTHGGCIRTSHAEAGAIAFAARNGIALKGGAIYCTLAPCINCARLIINAGIKKVFIDQEYRDPSGVIELIKASIEVTKVEV